MRLSAALLSFMQSQSTISPRPEVTYTRPPVGRLKGIPLPKAYLKAR